LNMSPPAVRGLFLFCRCRIDNLKIAEIRLVHAKIPGDDAIGLDEGMGADEKIGQDM